MDAKFAVGQQLVIPESAPLFGGHEGTIRWVTSTGYEVKLRFTAPNAGPVWFSRAEVEGS